MPVFGQSYAINTENEPVKNDVPSPFFVPHNRIDLDLKGAGTYKISWSFLWSHANIQDFFLARIRIAGQQLINTEDGGIYRKKPRSSVNTDATTGFTSLFLKSGVHVLILDFSTSVQFSESKIHGSTLEFYRVK